LDILCRLCDVFLISCRVVNNALAPSMLLCSLELSEQAAFLRRQTQVLLPWQRIKQYWRATAAWVVCCIASLQSWAGVALFGLFDDCGQLGC
jgi:hypothetical protein